MIGPKKNISVCALMPYPFDTAPSQRFRLEQWQPVLERNGISIDHLAFADEGLNDILHKKGNFAAKTVLLGGALLRRLAHVFAARKYDLIFVHRGISLIGPAFLEKLLRLYGARMIFDFDDSIFLADTSVANKQFGWAKFAGKTAAICRLSASVTVGNSYLADYARRYNKEVYVVPTSIDTDLYRPVVKSAQNGERIIVGWTGSSTSQYHLEEFEPVLERLLKERDVEIRVISNRNPSFKKIPFVWREWSSKTEVAETARLDIGIMPTPDDEWSRGKCAAKALQYMALAIPPVCSKMGANREVVRNGENGFLAKTDDEWIACLKKLIDDAALRSRLGAAARRTVVEKYSKEKCGALFAEVVYKTAEREPRKR